MTEQAVILSGVRTAVGDFGGSLKDSPPATLGTIVIAEAIRRAEVRPAEIGHVILGQVIPTCPEDAYLSRVAAIKAGIPITTPALTLNRLCGSGLQAIISGAQLIALGDCDYVVAGGAETMSKAPFHVSAARFGRKLGNIEMVDALTGTLSDPFDGFHMGVTAENVAERYGISREEQDRIAVESHRRAGVAIAEGRFRRQIVPVEIRSRGGATMFDTDEHVRGDTSLKQLAALRPAFRPGGTVTPGNASGINDGAAAVMLASRSVAEARGLEPLALIRGWGFAGVEPSLMGLGPIKAVPIALAQAGLTLDEIDVVESNEAFAAQAGAVARELRFDMAKTNVNGSGISIGHPVGATGAMLTVKALYELERSNGRFGLITLCIGGGQGIALVIERMAK